jgi:exodeoxyribonuclease III
MLKIATWNVNSIKARMPHLLDYLKDPAPDILVLQEIKCVDESFPRLEIEALGYKTAVCGQKTYNGVAILSKQDLPVEDPVIGLHGDESDVQARYIEATIAGVRVASIYLPNGNPIGTDKFKYKLGWMERLRQRAQELLTQEKPTVLGGDWNVCPTDEDVWDLKAMKDDALVQPQSRAAFRRILHQGWTDAIRARHPHGPQYTYWDYMQNRWPRDHGLRIDHLLLSPQAADRLEDAQVDRTPRAKEKASDHTVVWCTLNS